MKKMKLAAVIVGAVLITGSTISISAASIARDHHKSNSGTGNHGSGYLQGVSHGDHWAALHSILNPQGKDAAPVAPILAPSALLPFDTSTATLPQGDEGISDDSAAINEDDAGISDDDASPFIGAPSIPSIPSTTPTLSAGIPNPMTAPNGGSHEHADHSSDNSDD